MFRKKKVVWLLLLPGLAGLMLFYGHLHFVPAFVFIIGAPDHRAG